jgi:Ca-activated chloride channel family protein|tara:strand:+ start:2161 stop:3471 length:1311 start_codon:yes stop_codon:yes gene_type:complete
MSTITTKLDYEKVLAGQENMVHLATRIQAPLLETENRKPVAFTICLDRSGSMNSEKKFDYALKACEGVVQNLRSNDLFSLVTFDEHMEVVIPLGTLDHRERILSLIRELYTGGMTNLSGGWQVASNELKKAEPGMLKRMLLLTDGIANRGIIDDRKLITLVGDGMRNDGIRTSCLGFGESYPEDLLSDLATHATGNFYDVDTKDKLPAVFAAELEGALRISMENLRIRVREEDVCTSWSDFGGMRVTEMDDGSKEMLVGDLVSEEVRSFALEVKVEPRNALGKEKLISLDFAYDLITEHGTEVKSESQTLEVSFVEDLDEVEPDESVVPIVSNQRASLIIRHAIEKIDQGSEGEALDLLNHELEKLEAIQRPELTGDSILLIRSTIDKIKGGWRKTRGRKFAQYSSRSFAKMSSSEYWCAEESFSPSFKQFSDDEL